MANKEIGSLLVKMQGNASTLVKSVDNTINSLSRLSKGLEEIKNTSLKGLTSKFSTMANAMNKFANSFNEGTAKRIRSISSSMYQMGNSLKNFTNMNVNSIGMNFTRLSFEIEPFLNKLKESEPLLRSFNYALDVGHLVAQLQLANGQVALLNEKVKIKDNMNNPINELTVNSSFSLKLFVNFFVIKKYPINKAIITPLFIIIFSGSLLWLFVSYRRR